jgi:flagellum-specific peptidoglycan hydrolase FlgJ
MNVIDFLRKAVQSAQMAGHIWPEYAACEAALESAWGTSHLATECNNLFGQKSGHTSAQYPTKPMPTHEFQHGKLVPAQAEWPVFPDWETCFRERMNVLREARDKDENLIYGDALDAISGEYFVLAVSKHWATDPMRGEKVLDIYKAHQELLTGEKAG